MLLQFRNRRGYCIAELLVVLAILFLFLSLLLPAVQHIRESVRNTQCSTKLKQLGLAMENHLIEKRYYPQIFDVSPWSVAILDKLDGNELQRRIDLARNQADIIVYSSIGKSVFPIYQCPSAGLAFDPETSLRLGSFAMNFDVSIAGRKSNFPDGRDSTILCVETFGFRSPWIEGPIRATNSTDSPHSGRLKFLMCSGAVREVPVEIDPLVLNALSTPDGGEVVTDF